MKTVLDIFRDLIEANRKGFCKGIYSICSAHPDVLDACFKRAKKDKSLIVIESTWNQVDQYSGYTGMKFIFILIFLLSSTTSFSNNMKKSKPNFVFILVDDLGWADVNCYFSKSFYDTPNINKLATNGVRFTQAYSASTVCSPSRAALLTGKQPNNLNITDWIPGDSPKDRQMIGPNISHKLELKEVTMAEKLQLEGYKTCFIGKWHLGDEGFFPEDQGFDINIGGHQNGSPPGGYYSPYKNPKLEDGPEGEYLTDRLTSESIDFIEKNKNNPFFLYLAFYTVHTPIQASKRYIEKYKTKGETIKYDKILYKGEGKAWTKMLQCNPSYASMVAAMDYNVGRIIETLKNLGIDENTWVFFTSDNGGLSTHTFKDPPTSNEPLRAGKGWCYEGGIRVPLIIKGPKIAAPGRSVDQPVIGMDLYTTILSLAKVEHKKYDGENLLPILFNFKILNRNLLFWHYPHYHGSGWTPGSALRKDNWKLIMFYEDSHTELYDLQNDPGESNDLSSQFPKLTVELKNQLYEMLDKSNAKFPRPNSTIDNSICH